MTRASPAAASQQQKLLKYMPLFFGIFFFQVPTGLIVYWTTSNTWQIGQQYFLLRGVTPTDTGKGGGGGGGSKKTGPRGSGGSGGSTKPIEAKGSVKRKPTGGAAPSSGGPKKPPQKNLAGGRRRRRPPAAQVERFHGQDDRTGGGPPRGEAEEGTRTKVNGGTGRKIALSVGRGPRGRPAGTRYHRAGG